MAKPFFCRQNVGRLLALISGSRHGVGLQALAGQLECNRETVKRAISTLRHEYGAPITSTRTGYHWRPLPGDERPAALLIVFCGPTN